MFANTALVASLLAATALAQATTPTASSLDQVSVLAVLATALPQSLINLAQTNPAAASSIISSEFAAGETPAWFTGLPEDIQTYLVPVTTIPQAPGIIVSALPTQATNLATVPFSSLESNSTTITTTSSMPTMTVAANSTGFSNGTFTMPSNFSTTRRTPTTMDITVTETETSSTPRPTEDPTSPNAAAPMATAAVFGAGIAGVMGALGLLAL